MTRFSAAATELLEADAVWEKASTDVLGSPARLISASRWIGHSRAYEAHGAVAVIRLKKTKPPPGVHSLAREYEFLRRLAVDARHVENEQWEALITPRVNGIRFDHFLRACTFRQRARIIRRVAAELIRVHRAGIAHRDVRADNVLVDESGRVTLIDFDRARSGSRLRVAAEDWLGIGRDGSPSRPFPKFVMFTLFPQAESISRRIRAKLRTEKTNGPQDESSSLDLLSAAWSIAASSRANSPGHGLAYYALTVGNKHFAGERPWVPRWNAIRRHVDLRGKKVVELGCNMGLLATHANLEFAASVRAFDHDPQILDAARLVADAVGADVDFQLADFSATPGWEESAGGADLVFAMSVLHWVPDRGRLLRFLARQRELVYEGHGTLDEEVAMMRRLGFESIAVIDETERGRYLLHASRSRAGETVADVETAQRESQERLADSLRAHLVCPSCKAGLNWTIDACGCKGCGSVYPVVKGIAVFLGSSANGDRLKPSDTSKSAQAAFFDDLEHEFEIERPRGTTRLYEWMLRWKFELATTHLRKTLQGATAVAVCGGSGMDAEFLSRAGAFVISADISFGAAYRAQVRAQRHHFPLLSVVADAEHLPFADQGIDLAYVHDGLHHLVRPIEAVREMARVARTAISISEPADAALTALAVRLRLAREAEDAGNRVQRLTLADLASALTDGGFNLISARRYALLYRHQPGRLSRMLSGRWAPIARTALRTGNSIAGRWGNKLAVQAVRASD